VVCDTADFVQAAVSLGLDVGDPLYQYNDYDLKAVDKEYFDGMGLLKLIGRHASG
jgi:hypothetical protein